MTAPTIRRIINTGQAACRVVWRGYNAFYPRDVEARTMDRLWDRLQKRTGEPFGFVAAHDGKLLGFTHCFFLHSTSNWGPRCYMQDLFADPAARDAGLAPP